MCRFCEEHWYDDGYYDVDALSLRVASKYDSNVKVGISSYIDVSDNCLKMFACLDNKYTKPLHADKSVRIYYCPMCGRKLDKEPINVQH